MARKHLLVKSGARETVLLIGLVLIIPSSALAQSTSCVDCHYADPSTPARDHLADWERWTD